MPEDSALGEMPVFSEMAMGKARSERLRIVARIRQESGNLGDLAIKLSRPLGLSRDFGLLGEMKDLFKKEELITEGGWKKLAEGLSQGGGAEQTLGPLFLNLKRSPPRPQLTADQRKSMAKGFMRKLLRLCSEAAKCGASGAVALAVNEEIFSNLAEHGRVAAGLMVRSLDLPEDWEELSGESREDWRRAEERKKSMESHLLAGLLKRAEATDAKTALTEINLCWDFLSGSAPESWLRLPDRPTWGHLMREQEAWHEMVLERKRESSGGAAWAPILGGAELSENGLSAIELCGSFALWEEGKAMSHCVGTYADACQRGASRIFSIREAKGERVATVEIRREAGDSGEPGSGDRFAVAQIYGKFNREIKSKAARRLADKIAAAATEAIGKEAAPSPGKTRTAPG